MPRVQTASRPRSVAAHEAIMKAAAAILREQGYTKFTIEAIAKLSGAGKPTIYRWWPNKTVLLLELFDRETTHLMVIEDFGSTKHELLQWFNNVWHDPQQNMGRETYRSILIEMQSNPKTVKYFKESFLPHRRKILSDILERAQRRGELKGRDISTIVDYVLGFNWYYFLTHSTPSKKAIEEIIDTICSN